MFTRTFTSTSNCPLRGSQGIPFLLFFTFLLTAACGDGQPKNQSKDPLAPGQRKEEASAKESHAPQTMKQAAAEVNLPLETTEADSFFRDFAQKHPQKKAVIHTDFGDIKIKLYEDPPIHRGNFLFLAQRGYFDGTWFYRVREGHVIQAGNNDEMALQQERHDLGAYTLAAEQLQEHRHLRGKLAMARSYEKNSAKRSDPFEFYIVIGESYTRDQLQAMQEQQDLDLSPQQQKIYAQNPGSPHLEGQHTVFGEVISGMEAVMKINQVPTDDREWPKKDIPIRVTIPE